MGEGPEFGKDGGMKTYTVNVTRDEDMWMVDVPAIKRVTQALNLKEVDTIARDLITIMTSEPPENIALDMQVNLPASEQRQLELVRYFAHRNTPNAAPFSTDEELLEQERMARFGE